MQVSILDCTLRDGGFVNDWNFGHKAIANIYGRLVDAGVEYIEIGMMNKKEAFDIDRTIAQTTSDLNRIIDPLSSKVRNIAMIIIDDSDENCISEFDSNGVTGIRVVFKKSSISKAIPYFEKVKELGYDLFVQPASITDYSKDELKDMLEMVNLYDPHAVYIVDTYGLVERKELLNYYYTFDQLLNKKVSIGYHVHNNQNIAYSNSIELIEVCKNRDVIIDASVYGMGKNAGNTNTELIANYLNNNNDSEYDLSQLLEIINLEILKLKEQYNWGYSFQHFISAANKCHPKYVQHLYSKNTLSIESIHKILLQINKDKKTTFDIHHIEKLYHEYLKVEINDYNDINEVLNDIRDTEVLLLAPGPSLNQDKETVEKFININNPKTFSVNFIPENIVPDYIFISNAKRYNQLYYELSKMKCNTKIIITSNVPTIKSLVDYKFNFNKYLCKNNKIETNATLVLLNAIKHMNLDKIVVAGFDGYGENRIDYVGDFESFNQEIDHEELNLMICTELKKIKEHLQINSLTKSKYNLEVMNAEL